MLQAFHCLNLLEVLAAAQPVDMAPMPQPQKKSLRAVISMLRTAALEHAYESEVAAMDALLAYGREES